MVMDYENEHDETIVSIFALAWDIALAFAGLHAYCFGVKNLGERYALLSWTGCLAKTLEQGKTLSKSIEAV
jgi:hypothetical protein